MTDGTDLRGSLRRAADTLLALLQTRLALLNNELQGGALQAWQALVQAGAALLLLLLGLGCGVGFAVLALPQAARLWVLGGATALLVGAGIWLLMRARQTMAQPGGPFAASLEELARDRDHLNGSPE